MAIEFDVVPIEVIRQISLDDFFHEEECCYNSQLERFYKYLIGQGITTCGDLYDQGEEIVERYAKTFKHGLPLHVKKHLLSVVRTNIERLTV